ncbi:helix-hairpin-helix domain-containing protein [Patescibacteria group bacterium]|nr:helix-hairpin-helix domain-containing protein [Patescibacteria group bacterium]
MPQQNSIDKLFSKLLEEHKKEIGLFLVGVVFAGGILLSFLFSRRDSKKEIQVIANNANSANEINSEGVLGEESAATPGVTPIPRIKIDVAGAVINPGVCELGEGSRVQDAIDSAGGFSEKSDPDWVAKNINLALKVTDGEKIYIPTVEELQEELAQPATQNSFSGTSSSNYSSSSTSSGTSSSNSPPQITGKININTASQSELESLSGIGPVYAQRIIEARPFGSVEEVTRVKGIGAKTLEKIRDRICVE